ncbi:MAG: tRNA preQ1(34) S-adenosylmethionine ribosyltransferase-isomerase QueA [Phycisphaerae bacterium]|nr:tRNA preQ1(34) S-adenosylmethionine ribosyltransferase-isomerase QueA [Phycisphaerae bacterium]
MKTSELQFELPPELIAQAPLPQRDASRLMVVDRRARTIAHHAFRDIVLFISPQDAIVLNRTRVMPAKFTARRVSGGRIGGLFVQELEPGRWQAMLSGVRKLKEGEWLILEDPTGRSGKQWKLCVERRHDRGLCDVAVTPPQPAARILDVVGVMPLPPYIRRAADSADALDRLDRERYQTVFAETPGAVAAPTAGLHFTPELLHELRESGVACVDCVLHVGLGTFQPVVVDDLSDHVMHRESFELNDVAVETLQNRRDAGGRIIAVGTTSVRVLESCSIGGKLRAGTGWTDILIYPPYRFQSVDALVTNFHLPGSTLIALVAAFAGLALVRDAYQAAIAERYRFFSYGDAMLIL